ncbi:MAG: flagellar type III secretion system pore protein FliP [Planctomycetota bacterium]|nr:flagellar type III secretion system pore protein FliP [Planctomycetota bacterium]
MKSPRLSQFGLPFCIRLVGLALVVLSLVGLPASALAQGAARPAAPTSPAAPGSSTRLDPTNPISILENAARALPMDRLAGGAPAGNAGSPATGGDSASSNFASGTSGGRDGGQGLSTTISILLLLTVLSIAPALLVMCTSFTRMIIVLSLLRQAIGTQSLPPSQVIVGLSLFLTLLVMAPTFDRIHKEALIPLQENRIDQLAAWTLAKAPLRDFMFDQIEHAGNWSDVYMLLKYRGIDTSQPEKLTRGDVDMLTLIPAFILSELKVAFLIGFRLYLPFLIIDMVVSSVLISMGMLMLPPVLVSLPFKLLLFVLVDGWQLVAGNLLNSFVVSGVPGAG